MLAEKLCFNSVGLPADLLRDHPAHPLPMGMYRWRARLTRLMSSSVSPTGSGGGEGQPDGVASVPGVGL